MEKRSVIKDLEKLSKAFYRELQLQENGEGWGIGIDGKRPFGNSGVLLDVLEIIEWPYEDGNDDQLEYARSLYRERLVPYLKKQHG
jgi:hypothetical protein